MNNNTEKDKKISTNTQYDEKLNKYLSRKRKNRKNPNEYKITLDSPILYPEYPDYEEYLKREDKKVSIKTMCDFVIHELDDYIEEIHDYFIDPDFDIESIAENISFDLILDLKQSQSYFDDKSYSSIRKFASNIYYNHEHEKPKTKDDEQRILNSWIRKVTRQINKVWKFYSQEEYKKFKGSVIPIFNYLSEYFNFIIKCSLDKTLRSATNRSYNNINSSNLEFLNKFYKEFIFDKLNSNEEHSTIVLPKILFENHYCFNYISKLRTYIKNTTFTKIYAKTSFLNFIQDIPDHWDVDYLIDNYFTILNSQKSRSRNKNKLLFDFRVRTILYYHVLPEIIKTGIIELAEYCDYKLKDADNNLFETYSNKYCNEAKPILIEDKTSSNIIKSIYYNFEINQLHPSDNSINNYYNSKLSSDAKYGNISEEDLDFSNENENDTSLIEFENSLYGKSTRYKHYATFDYNRQTINQRKKTAESSMSNADYSTFLENTFFSLLIEYIDYYQEIYSNNCSVFFDQLRFK